MGIARSPRSRLGGVMGNHLVEARCPGSSFRSRLSLGGGTGNGPMISVRQSLITEHHSVSSLNDPAREASPCSRYLRPAPDVDTTCTVGANVHESMAAKVRAHRAPNLLRGCGGRSDRSAQAIVIYTPSTGPAAVRESHGRRRSAGWTGDRKWTKKQRRLVISRLDGRHDPCVNGHGRRSQVAGEEASPTNPVPRFCCRFRSS